MGFVPWSVSFFYYCFPFYRLCALVADLTSQAVVSDPSTDYTFHLRFREQHDNRVGNLKSAQEERLNVSVYQRHVAWIDISPCLEQTETYSWYGLRQFLRLAHFLADFSDQLIVKRETNGREAPFWIQKPWCLCVCVKSAKHTVKINHTLLCLRASLCVREEEGKEKKMKKAAFEHVQDYRISMATTSSYHLVFLLATVLLCVGNLLLWRLSYH